jgi:glycosyltransferase involved in cell wall biosynthesis
VTPGELDVPVAERSVDGSVRTPVDVELLVPDLDVTDPEVSIVVPALNEELTIEDFVRWCHEGLARANVVGEILIVDSSTDSTPQRALALGARVLRTPKRGLGRAYLDAIPHIRGRFVIMGDADCTYDFRELAPFVEKFREGYEFVMGTRFKGYIEPGSMPPHHRYFGTPLTTWILNRVYSSSFSDIHCGMRGISREALQRLDLQSQSWEYASEMVLKSVHLGLKTGEVPVRFLKDRDGRVSHHKRLGWFSPFQAAWINLQAMFIHGADFFVYRPGIVLLGLGLLITIPVTFGPVDIGPITLSLTSQFIGVLLAIVGLQGYFLGNLARIFFDYTGNRTEKLLLRFRYTRAAIASAGVFFLGAAMVIPLIVRFVENDLSLPVLSTANYLAVTGLFLMVTGFSTFVFTLLIHAAALASKSRRSP